MIINSIRLSMDKNSTPNEESIAAELENIVNSGIVPLKYQEILLGFYDGVKEENK